MDHLKWKRLLVLTLGSLLALVSLVSAAIPTIAVEELNSSEVKILSEQEKIEAHERRQAEMLAEAAARDGHTADEVADEVAEVMNGDADEDE